MTGVAAVLVAGAAGFSWWKFGSAFDLRRVWSPGTLTVLDRRTDLGPLPPNGVFLFHVKVRNDAARPLTIVGARSACKCMAADKLPVTLAVGATHPLRMALRLDGAKAAEIPVVVFTEDGQAHEAAVEFSIESPSPPKSPVPSPAPTEKSSPLAAGQPPRGAS